MKKLLLILLLMTSIGYSYGQSGDKWATGGNSIGAGDIFGTTTNYPLLFHTNNTQKMSLSTSGVLQLNNLIGTGTRLLQTDASGNIVSFGMGTPTQVLYGNGTWGSLPTIPSVLWSTSGSSIYYNIGKVGIGTATPLYPLDVVGDARISNNLYVGGGIVITDKVNANTEVVTSRVQADSIVTDSTKGFYGTSKFNGDVKLQSKLNVDGTATIGGTLKLLGGLTFGTVPPISLDPCFEMLAIGSDGTLVQLDATSDLSFDPSTSPCPEPPIIPFTWQTWGNHVNNDNRWIGTIENHDFRIKTNSVLRMVVKKDGKIGIGTATPAALLDVNGDVKVSGTTKISGKTTIGVQTISAGMHADAMLTIDGKIVAKSAYVTLSGWADYVFYENYNLPSLSEVEKFYKINKHLPEIPSEKQVLENGVDLAEMNKLLLKKIEELTLYVVQQEKEINIIKNKLK